MCWASLSDHQLHTREHTPKSLPLLHLLAVANTGTQQPDFPYPPVVVAAITAANTLLLVASLATFIASCAVLIRAKRGRHEHTVHDYETADDGVKGQVVKVDSKTGPVYADVADLPLPTRLQYQELQMHTMQSHQYTTATTQ